MDKLDSYIVFVKEQIRYHEDWAHKTDTNDYRRTRHQRTADTFKEILTLFESFKAGSQDQSSQRSAPVNMRRKAMLSLGDIQDIPSELLEELNLSETDKQEMAIESIIADAGGVVSLEKILVELYHRTKVVYRRNVIILRLHRMNSRGLVYSLPGKKGLYSNYEMTQQDVKRLFGQLDGEPEATPAPLAVVGGASTPLTSLT